MDYARKAGFRRPLPLLVGLAASAALVGAGCGEKSEPDVHPPTTATPTVTATQPTAPPATTTQPAPGTTPAPGVTTP